MTQEEKMKFIELTKDRDCHGFMNPCGLRPRAVTGTGMGTGWSLINLAQPVPVRQVAGTVVTNVTLVTFP